MMQNKDISADYKNIKIFILKGTMVFQQTLEKMTEIYHWKSLQIDRYATLKKLFIIKSKINLN